MKIIYDSKDCLNSEYWQNMMTIGTILKFVALLLFLTAIVLLFIYLLKKKGKKQNKSKPLLIALIISLMFGLIFNVGGFVVSTYVNESTKDLPTCWN